MVKKEVLIHYVCEVKVNQLTSFMQSCILREEAVAWSYNNYRLLSCYGIYWFEFIWQMMRPGPSV